MRSSLIGFLAVAASASAAPDPAEVSRTSIQQVMSQSFNSAVSPGCTLSKYAVARLTLNSQFWSWTYGPAIELSAAYEASSIFGVNWTRSLDRRLQQLVTDPTQVWHVMHCSGVANVIAERLISMYAQVGYQVLNNISIPWDSAVCSFSSNTRPRCNSQMVFDHR
jgi:hypothetical protein